MSTTGARRVGLNAHLLNLSGNYRSAGINWYIYHLLQNLPAVQPTAPADRFDYTVFLSEARAREHFRAHRIALSRLPTHKPMVRIAWEQVMLPLALRRARLDLLHALAFAGPRVISIPWVVTIYDLSFIHYPASFNAANRLYLKWAVRDALRRASRVIAISSSTGRDLARLDPAGAGKVKVVYCGVDPTYATARPAGQVEAFRVRHRLPSRFILFVGTIEPRKNITRLLRAFARLRRTAHLPHVLVLIGARGWKYDEVDAVVEEEGIREAVVFPGYVPQEEMPLWYRAAELFVYPSLYEGFGLPPLEAMASGTPVVASNASSLPEVVGDAGLVVSPHDESELADAMARVLNTPALRQDLVARGLKRVEQFSWARAARETVDVYTSVLQEREHSPQSSSGVNSHAKA